MVLGLSTLYLAIENNNLNNKFYQLEEASLRADINVLINPIPNQNWTFTSNGTFLMVDGILFNEGARSTLITKVEVAIIYNFSDGEEYVDLFPSNLRNFYMEKYTVAPTESRLFNISIVAYPSIALNENTGEFIGIYESRPDKIRLFVWHNDGVGEQLDYGNA